MIDLDPTEIRAALRAKQRAEAFHLTDENVSLIDIGWKIKESAGRQIVRNLAVRVHLRRKPVGPAFEAFSSIFPERVVSEDRIGFPVDIIEADYRLSWSWWMPWYPPPRARFFDPLQGGISISNEFGFGSGTLGGFVRDRTTGELMILSNWHVLAGSAYTRKGARIFQPGYGEGGRSQHTIGYLERHGMEDGIDAAVAMVNDFRSWKNDQLDLGAVSGVVSPQPDMQVTKSGRTSEVTEGMVTGVGGVKMIRYGRFERIVRNIIHIAPSPEGGEVSAPGDSGSWWLEKNSNNVAGLHFAGDNLPEYGLAIDMPVVMDYLNVELATGQD